MIRYPAMQDDEWLARVTEPILDPERPICDPHHHLWDARDDRQDRYLLEELLRDLETGHNVVSTVFVECASEYRTSGPEALCPVGETEFANAIAARAPNGGAAGIRVCAGIVAFADLNLGRAVGDVLDAHIAASPRFRGIRHTAGWDPSDAVRNSHSRPFAHMLADPTFREGYAELRRRNLSFDAWLYHHQIPELVDLARAFPDVPIVLDHFGGPLGIGPYAGQREAIFESWKRDVAALAECHNVSAKLGGLLMPINGFGFHKRSRPATSDEIVATTGPYHRHMIERFGPDRCMFESNFPVDRQSCSYAVLWNAFKKIAADLSEVEKSSLFLGTANRVYRLV